MNAFAAVFGTTPGVFVGVTLALMGGCAFMTGQAQASTWRPAWKVIPYCLLLGAADRFLVYGLFDGDLSSLPGYLLDSTILGTIALLSFRATRARQMARQYPWLYERTGLFSWHEKGQAAP